MDFRDDDNESPDSKYEFQFPEPDDEFESPEPRAEFDYDPAPFFTEEVNFQLTSINNVNNLCMLKKNFIPFQVFDSYVELIDWAQSTGREVGYVLIKRRSNRNWAGAVNKVTLVCSRSGKRDERSKGIRGSAKIECPFRLEGHMKRDGRWTVTVVDHRHNHAPIESMEGHAYLRRMSDAEKEYVATALELKTDPHVILVNMKEKFPGNLSRLKDISNFRRSFSKNSYEQMGETPMQVMFHLLQDGKYLYHHTTNRESGRLRNLFFIHPVSFEMWRAFPWIIEIDATYKTNIYNMPLVEIVGVTSTGRTFSIAYALIESEQEAHYRWVLQCLRSTLDEGFAVRVVLTDRDLALMRACQYVMPDAKQLVCRIHIWRNISRHCEPALHAKHKWGHFHHWWSVLVQSRTVTEYADNERQLKANLDDLESTSISIKLYTYFFICINDIIIC